MSRAPSVQAGHCDGEAEKTYDPIKSCLWGKQAISQPYLFIFPSGCKVQYIGRSCDYHIKGYAKWLSKKATQGNFTLAPGHSQLCLCSDSESFDHS